MRRKIRWWILYRRIKTLMIHRWSVRTPGLIKCPAGSRGDADRNVIMAREKTGSLNDTRACWNRERTSMTPVRKQSPRQKNISQCMSEITTTVNHNTMQWTEHPRLICMREAAAVGTRSCQLYAQWMTDFWKHYIKGRTALPIGLPITMMKSPEMLLGAPSLYRSKWDRK